MVGLNAPAVCGLEDAADEVGRRGILKRNQKEEEQRKTEDKKDSRGGVMDGMGKRTRMRNSEGDIEDGEGL